MHFYKANGEWGAWGAWSAQPCSKSCGQGTKTRTRDCDNPFPDGVGAAWCDGVNVGVMSQTETKNCNKGACPSE